MRRAGLVSLLPLPCLLVIALLAQAWNHRPHFTAKPTPKASVGAIEDDQDTVQLRKELKTVLLRYRELSREKRKEATYPPAWERWQDSLDGNLVAQRLDRMRSWSDFSVRSIELRNSGFITALVYCDGDYLKVWLLDGPDGWKVAGLVKPF